MPKEDEVPMYGGFHTLGLTPAEKERRRVEENRDKRKKNTITGLFLEDAADAQDNECMNPSCPDKSMVATVPCYGGKSHTRLNFIGMICKNCVGPLGRAGIYEHLHAARHALLMKRDARIAALKRIEVDET